MKLVSASEYRSLEQLETFFHIVDTLRSPWIKGIDPYYVARGKVMVIVTNEPSTRTRLSFEVAMKRLGGEVCWLSLDNSSSVAKGESTQDSIKVASQLGDVLVIRHSDPEIIHWAKNNLNTHLINAGNGSEEHPTQALLDAYTIREKIKTENMHILFCGDLTFSRTMHSLLYLLSLYPNTKFTFVANSDRNKIPAIVKDANVFDNLEAALLESAPIDVLYMTRLQEERKTFTGRYPGITERVMKLLPENSIIMHPLPRLTEIPTWVDSDKRAVYFDQVKNGLYVRMGLLYQIFGLERD